jgi:hypothetical protein
VDRNAEPELDTVIGLFDLMSDQQRDAWIGGVIENVRFDPESGMLSYRLTAAPTSLILCWVPDERWQKWQEKYEHRAPR